MSLGSGRPVVLVSIDGLLPEHLEASPLLARLALEGACSRDVEPVFPTLTYTNHASLVTGRTSDRHGIVANTRFDPSRVRGWIEGEPVEWEVDATDLREATLWDAAEAQGLSCALLRWPTTVGARARWVLPEIFPSKAEPSLSTWELSRRVSTPELVARSEAWPGFVPPESHPELDAHAARLAIELLRDPGEPPDLMLLHLIMLDHELHEHGRSAPGAGAILATIEGWLEEILAAIHARDGVLVVCGDHGFRDIERRFHPNALLASQGWIRAQGDSIQGWEAIAHTGCGQAAIYLREPGDSALATRVEHALREREGLGYRVISRRELDELHAFPGACCAIEGVGPVSMGQALDGAWVTQIGETRGEHGYLGPDMRTACVFSGPRIAARELGPVSILDVPATVAELLGLSFSCDGRDLLAGVPSARPAGDLPSPGLRAVDRERVADRRRRGSG